MPSGRIVGYSGSQGLSIRPKREQRTETSRGKAGDRAFDNG
jgi:hypothetical protein